MSIFDLFKKKAPKDFTPTKKMMEAAILKGKRIGLSREEIIEMTCLMDKSRPKLKVEKLVDKLIS